MRECVVCDGGEGGACFGGGGVAGREREREWEWERHAVGTVPMVRKLRRRRGCGRALRRGRATERASACVVFA